MANKLKKRKHNLRKQNFEQKESYKRRLDNYNDSIKNVSSISKRLQLLKDNLSGKEYKELVDSLKSVLVNFLTDSHDDETIKPEDYAMYLEDGNKIFDLIAIDDVFSDYLKLQLVKEGVFNYE